MDVHCFCVFFIHGMQDPDFYPWAAEVTTLNIQEGTQASFSYS